MIETVLDFETTGFPSNSLAPDDPDQPHIVQFGLIVRAEDRIVAKRSALVECPVDVPEEAMAVHGISKDATQQYGVGLFECMRTVGEMIKASDVVIAHNIDFDLKLLKIGLARAALWPAEEVIGDRQQYCTMREWQKQFGGRFKKLDDCFAASGGVLQGLASHDAFDDCTKALKVYDHLVGRQMDAMAGDAKPSTEAPVVHHPKPSGAPVSRQTGKATPRYADD